MPAPANKKIDWEKLDLILKEGATLKEAAQALSYSTDALYKNIKRKYKCTFTEYRKRKKNGVIGRERKEFDWDKLDLILQFDAMMVEAVEIMKVSETLIIRRIKEKYQMTFDSYRNKKMSRAKQNLRRKQYDLAIKGNATMNIWLGKQWLGQSDNPKENQQQCDKLEITFHEAS